MLRVIWISEAACPAETSQLMLSLCFASSELQLSYLPLKKKICSFKEMDKLVFVGIYHFCSYKGYSFFFFFYKGYS